MKILWISHFIPYPPKGGALQRSHNLLKQTAQRHEVDIVSLNHKKNLLTQEVISEAVEFLKRICRNVQIFPIQTDRSKLHWLIMVTTNFFSNNPYDVNWLYNSEMMSYMKCISKSKKYDLIHVDTIGLYQYCVPFSNVPIVLNHHNIESNMMLRRYENESRQIKKIYFKKEADKLRNYEKKICQKCSVNLVVSDLDGIRLNEIVGNVQIKIVPNGVDTDYFQPSYTAENDDRGLIFVGPMDWYPNRSAVQFFLSEIFPKLKEENPNRPITIVGRNPPTELLNAARHSSIIVTGFVDDIRPYMNSAKIYICPIKDGGGTRLKILDALAMGKPLVATEIAVEGLDLIEEKHYLRAESALEFVKQIKRLDCDEKLCRDLSISGRRLVEKKYSWEIIGNTLDDAYKDGINSNKNNV